MNKNKKNKGLTFLETIAGVAIIFIVSSFLFYKIIKHNEKMELEKSRRIIQTFFVKYTLRSLYEKNVYQIEINLLDKNLNVKKLKNEIIEQISLPKKLKYEIIYDNNRNHCTRNSQMGAYSKLVLNKLNSCLTMFTTPCHIAR